MSALLDSPAAKQLRTAIAQDFFDFLVPRKEWHTPEEVAGYIGMKQSFVYELIEAGRLDSHNHNAGSELKLRRRIHRTAVISYLLKTASYEPADYVSRLCELIDRLPLTSATLVADHAVRHRNRVLTR
jgi:excisionase family DNA binding protein